MHACGHGHGADVEREKTRRHRGLAATPGKRHGVGRRASRPDRERCRGPSGRSTRPPRMTIRRSSNRRTRSTHMDRQRPVTGSANASAVHKTTGPTHHNCHGQAGGPPAARPGCGSQAKLCGPACGRAPCGARRTRGTHTHGLTITRHSHAPTSLERTPMPRAPAGVRLPLAPPRPFCLRPQPCTLTQPWASLAASLASPRHLLAHARVAAISHHAPLPTHVTSACCTVAPRTPAPPLPPPPCSALRTACRVPLIARHRIPHPSVRA